MSKNRVMKDKFRHTVEWKEFRKQLQAERGVDELTGKKLAPGWNLHHLCLDPSKYTDISNPDNFSALNRKSHDCTHFLWGKNGNGWRERMQRLWKILEKMEKLNK